MRKFLIIIFLFLVLIFLYGRYIEPDKLIINEYTIESETIPESFKELKFVHFSDLLYDGNITRLNKIKEKINSLKPDVVFFTGDLFKSNYNYSEEDYNDMESFLNGIEVLLYKYAIIGDNDYKHLEKYKDILDKADFILLDNSNFLLFYKENTPINIIGIYDNYEIEELLNNDITYDYSILLTHKSDDIIFINDYVNLVLAGHSLGGIINVPYYGGLIKKEGANTYINNYYNVKNSLLYVSNGLGYENFNFRLFNTPSINVYRFK